MSGTRTGVDRANGGVAAARMKSAAEAVKRAPRKAVAKLSRSVLVDYGFDATTKQIIEQVSPYTMVSPERISSVIESVRYVVRADIPGAIVECGVWRGGSMMAAALALLDAGVTDRDLYLFDTFEGMTAPTEVDRSRGVLASEVRDKYERVGEEGSTLAYASLEDVQEAMKSTGYPAERIHYVKGRVERTVPDSVPDAIAMLRLDTDWYESTKHELTHMTPVISPFGIVIIDDYGCWEGARKATDEFVADYPLPIMLHRIDRDGRAFILPRS
jgi:O-methyltransferase